MDVVYDLKDYWLEGESVLTIGVFDGVHRGHQALIHRVVERARATGRHSGVITFFPHPSNVLAPGRPIKFITTPAERAALLERMNVDFMIVLQFTSVLANQEPQQFISDLAAHLRPAEIWVGPDFAFGRDRKGNLDLLRKLSERMGFTVHTVAPVYWNGAVISSSRIRKLLEAGDMEEVAALLGRYYTLVGRVSAGSHRGRQLGFPTANVQFESDRALPRDGVFACYAVLGTHRVPAVANLGVRPTFHENAQRLLEVYVMDMDVDLYECDLAVELVAWLRPELKFDSVEALVHQMQSDVINARRILRNGVHPMYELPAIHWSNRETG